ncbi:MAG: hypothetical protein A3C43_05955 [Candidatus Schekmanbacteria bacterium RIFCSPHIGHO2_02_FULL_38_11]|nr:MAG: hypothetical protein A3C43_05955 [Candidatus Schekmanbacteria bacterium RIFCSPHIGHO2_02_FULL_38_11]
MSNKELQIKNGFIYLLPMIVSNLLPFMALPVFTRILTSEDYGVLALAQIYAILLSGLANLGMTVAYDRNFFQFRDKHQETAQLLYSTLLFVMINFLILSTLTYFFRGMLSKFIIGSSEKGNILFWALCAQFFQSINYYYLAYFKNSEIADRYSFYTILFSLIDIFIALFLIAYLRIGVIGLVYAQFCSAIIVFCVLSYKFINKLPPSLNKTIFYDSLKIAYPLTPRIFLGVINTQFDKYMIGLLASIGGVGIYSIGQKISDATWSLMNTIHNVYYPQVYKKMFSLGEKGGEEVGRYLTPFFYASLAGALMVALFSEEVIILMTPELYHGAIDIVIILSMSYGCLFFGMQPQLVFAKRTHIISILFVSRIIVTVAFNIPFILKWGAIGAAWATFLAGLISGAISFIVGQHYYEVKWEYRRVAAIFLTLLGSSLLMIVLRDAMITYPFRLAVKMISLSLYAYIGVKIRVITSENWALVKNVLGGFSSRKEKYRGA